MLTIQLLFSTNMSIQQGSNMELQQMKKQSQRCMMLIMLATVLQQEDSTVGQNPQNKEKWNSVKNEKTTLPWVDGNCIVLANIIQA